MTQQIYPSITTHQQLPKQHRRKDEGEHPVVGYSATASLSAHIHPTHSHSDYLPTEHAPAIAVVAVKAEAHTKNEKNVDIYKIRV